MPFASEDTDDPISSLPHQSDTHHLMSLTNGWVVAICTNSCLSLYAQSDCCLPIDVFPGSLRPVSSSSTYYLRWAEGYIYQERSDTGPSCRTSSVKGRHFSIQHRESESPGRPGISITISVPQALIMDAEFYRLSLLGNVLL